MDLDQPVTQAEFGELVGVSQQAVSDLMARKVIERGQPARVWLLAYCAALRETAAGRDPEGRLAEERTRVAKEQADRLAIMNARSRREFMPVELLHAALALLSRQIGKKLDAVVPYLRRHHPDIPQAAMTRLAHELAECRALCAGITLESKDDSEDEEGEGD